ncbi:MAG: pyridoxal 5'-phosphate synthase glutaminase subunit PdxT [Gaiellaceae bacterium]
MEIGVLALQGDFREHGAMLRALGAHVREVRLPEQLDGLDGLVLPGGESTTIARLMGLYGLDDAIRQFGGALFGTCAGMIVLASGVTDGVHDQPQLELIDIVVQRNGYGRQVASFEADVQLENGSSVPGMFIRAPKIVSLGDNVEELGHLEEEPVLVREGRVLAASFHPELTRDRTIHASFVELVEDCRSTAVGGGAGS